MSVDLSQLRGESLEAVFRRVRLHLHEAEPLLRPLARWACDRTRVRMPHNSSTRDVLAYVRSVVGDRAKKEAVAADLKPSQCQAARRRAYAAEYVLQKARLDYFLRYEHWPDA